MDHLYDDSKGASITVIAGNVAGYGYLLAHQDRSSTCHLYFLYEPTGSAVSGHYGSGLGACSDSTILRSIAEDVAFKCYPTTGTRINQSASQAFSLEVEEAMEAEEDVTQEDIGNVEIAIEEMLFLITE